MNNLAYLYVDDLDDPNGALVWAKKAYRLQPDFNVLDTYGWVLARLGGQQSDPGKKQDLLNQARQVLERSMELQKTSANRYHCGWVMEQQGQKDKALRLYQQAFADVRDKKSDPLYEPLKKAIDRLSR
jgi:tetratricopeptide (TPR) repeat protein